MTKPLGFIIERSVDRNTLRQAFELLDRAEVGYQIYIADASIDPVGLRHWVESFEGADGKYIAVVDQPGGITASFASVYTLLPVFTIRNSAATGYNGHGQDSNGTVPALTGRNPQDAIKFLLRLLAHHDANLRNWLFQDRRDAIMELAKTNLAAQGILQSYHPNQSSPSLRNPSDTAESEPSDDQEQRGQTVRPVKHPMPHELPASSEADDAMVEEFARNLRPRLKTEADPAPVPLGPKPLDYSLPLREAIGEARTLATGRNPSLVGPLHLLGAMCQLPGAGAYQALVQAGADCRSVLQEIELCLGPQATLPAGSPQIFGLDDRGEASLSSAKAFARMAGRGCLTTVDVLAALAMDEDEQVISLFVSAGVSPDVLQTVLLDGGLAGQECADLLAAQNEGVPPVTVPATLDPEELVRLQQRFLPARDVEEPEAGDSSEHSVAHGELTAEAGVSDERQTGTAAGKGLEQSVTEYRAKVQQLSSANSRPASRKRSDIRITDPQNPDLDTVEQIVDRILDGAIVVLPTDLNMSAIVDATNASAVERLRIFANRASGQPLMVLVHSTSTLKNIVRSFPPSTETFLDNIWPSPLAVVFERHPKRFQGIASEPTIGIRLPDHYLTLAILSMLGRPVAAVAVDVDFSETPPALHLFDAGEPYGNADILVHFGESPQHVQPTIISVVGKTYRILRQGPVTSEQIRAAGGTVAD